MGLCGCHKDKSDPVEPGTTQAHRTVLVYMSAQNSLKNFANGKFDPTKTAILSDSTEIMNGRAYLANNDRMLVFIDDAEDKGPRLYRIVRQWDKPQLVAEWDKSFNSTDPEQFQTVLEKVKTDFPAQEYGLVMWSHADGWLPAKNKQYTRSASSVMLPQSFGIEEKKSSVSTQMEVSDLAKAIAQAGMHMRFIQFDACLMQGLEVGYALRNVTDYVVASPMSIASAGGYYIHLMQNGLFANSPDSIISTYYRDVASAELSSSVYENVGIVISCVRTNQLQTLANSLKAALPYSTLMQHTSTDMNGVLDYHNYCAEFYYRPHSYDALQALERILPTAQYLPVKSALLNAITSYKATSSIWVGPYSRNRIEIPVASGNYCGVSLFIPQSIYTLNATKCDFGDLNQAFQQTEWYEACGWGVTGW